MLSARGSFPLTVVLVIALALVACSDSPVVENSQTVVSPDGEFVATLETIDNGLGFGLGREYEEVHLSRRGAGFQGHGASGSTVAFYVEASERPHVPLSVRWLSSRELEVSFDSPTNPGRSLAFVDGISLRYKRAPTQ